MYIRLKRMPKKPNLTYIRTCENVYHNIKMYYESKRKYVRDEIFHRPLGAIHLGSRA